MVTNFPRWLRWAIPPLLAPLAAIVWIGKSWERIPARYASHFRPGGQPDGWQTRTPLHVFGVAIFAEGIVMLIVGVMLATWFGSRRAQSHGALAKIFLAVSYLLAAVFTVAAISPVVHVPAWPFVVAIPLTSIGLIAYIATTLQSQPDATPDDTPKENWGLDGVYHNPADQSLFVPARAGMGYTLNFGHRWARPFLIALIGSVIVLISFLL